MNEPLIRAISHALSHWPAALSAGIGRIIAGYAVRTETEKMTLLLAAPIEPIMMGESFRLCISPVSGMYRIRLTRHDGSSASDPFCISSKAMMPSYMGSWPDRGLGWLSRSAIHEIYKRVMFERMAGIA